MVFSTYCIWTLFTSHLHLYMLSASGHVVHMLSAGHPNWTYHLHFVCKSSTVFLILSMDLNYLLMLQEFVIKWNLWQHFWIILFQDHVNYLRDNLCWWFSLHIASGHCSHLICICTCCLHQDMLSTCCLQAIPTGHIIYTLCASHLQCSWYSAWTWTIF